MSEVHDGAERRPKEGADHRTDAISNHALGYGVSVTWAVQRGKSAREGRRFAHVSPMYRPAFSLPFPESSVVRKHDRLI